MFFRTYQASVHHITSRSIRQVRDARVLIYFPHGFGDGVFLSVLIPLLEPSNQYYIARYDDDHTSLFEGSPYITPLYAGVARLNNRTLARDFGMCAHEADGQEQTLWVSEALHRQMSAARIDTVFWLDLPEHKGRVPFPFHSKPRNVIRDIVPEHIVARTDLTGPLPSCLGWDTDRALRNWIEARVRHFIGDRRLCVIARSGYTSAEKNWGHLWREDMPPGKRIEGEECRDFMRMLFNLDPTWGFISMDDMRRGPFDTPASPVWNCFPYFEVFGSPSETVCPFGMILRVLLGMAELVVGVPTGPYHLAMAKPGLPVIGIWLDHLSSWYDEPRDGTVHLVSQNTRSRGYWDRPGSIREAGGLAWETVDLQGRVATGEEVLSAVEKLGLVSPRHRHGPSTETVPGVIAFLPSGFSITLFDAQEHLVGVFSDLGETSLASTLRHLRGRGLRGVIHSGRVSVRGIDLDWPEVQINGFGKIRLAAPPLDREQLIAEAAQDSILGQSQLVALYQRLAAVWPLDGAAAEVGVYGGGTARFIARCLHHKRVYLLDTYGDVPPGGDDDVGDGDVGDGSWEVIERALRGCPNVELRRGTFPETARNLPERFSFVHMDGNLYRTTRDALDFFYPRIVPGGVIALDDNSWPNGPAVERAMAAYMIGKRGYVEASDSQVFVTKG